MTLLELLRQIQDACKNDGNLNREVYILAKSVRGIALTKVLSVETNHPEKIVFIVND